ncbi:MAG: thiol-disulfide oxidoreductase DCC family protein [Planctomycetia bacterium]
MLTVSGVAPPAGAACAYYNQINAAGPEASTFVARRRPENAVEAAKTKIIYDDHCPMCTTQMGLLSRIDGGRRLEFVPLSSPEALVAAPGIEPAELQAAMHVAAPNGRLYKGARGVRYISGRLWILWPLAVVLWIPGVITIAEWVYRRIAANRLVLSKVFGCTTACKVVFPKKTAVATAPTESPARVGEST